MAMTDGYTDDVGDDFGDSDNDGDDLVIAMIASIW